MSGAASSHIGNGINDGEVIETTNMQKMHSGLWGVLISAVQRIKSP